MRLYVRSMTAGYGCVYTVGQREAGRGRQAGGGRQGEAGEGREREAGRDGEIERKKEGGRGRRTKERGRERDSGNNWS